jgi:hypothetical protein
MMRLARALDRVVLLSHTWDDVWMVLQWSSRVQCLSAKISMLLPKRW